MSRAQRVAAIRQLQDVRDGTNVISYVTSTRPGLEAQMGMDVITPFLSPFEGFARISEWAAYRSIPPEQRWGWNRPMEACYPDPRVL